MTRPSEAVFADGRHARPLAIHPEAIGVSYPTRPAEQIRRAQIASGVAVLCVDGPLEHKSGGSWWSYWQTYEDLARDFKSLLDDGSVRAVVLKFDSPGGECAGLNETVAIMQRMKVDAGKPVIAYVDEACYSAAYALAMVADEIFLPESGGVGSIGVITAMADITKLNEKQGVRVEVIASGSKKTDGHPCVPISDGAIKRTRKSVDRLAASFFDLVASSRGLSVDTVAGFQAGIFAGQAAVDAGLADGIMSLAECLTIATNEFSSSNGPNDRSEEKESNMGRLAAVKALNDAQAAMTAAKTDSDRAICAARVLSAEAELAKVKKTKTVTTDTHEEEIDDGEPEESEMPDDGEDDDDTTEDDADAMGDDDEYKGKKAAASAPITKAGRATAVLALAREITGKVRIDEVMGALRGMHASYKKTTALAAKVAKLEADAESGRVTALIAQGLKAGKIAPSQRAWAKTQTPASLKAYLDAAPRMVHTTDDEHTEARVEGSPAGAVTAEMARIWRKLGHAEKDFPALLAKMNGNAKHTNGAS